MIVAVGSRNPTKIKPVKQIFSRHFKDVKVVGVDVESGVADQPLSEEEMFKGAFNRAVAAISEVKDADFGVGIEGGLSEKSFGWFEKSIVVIVDQKGNRGIGASSGLILPDILIRKIKKGNTLEQVVDEIFGTHKIGEGIGMFGIMTKGVVTRSEGVSHGIAFALARFLHKKIYES